MMSGGLSISKARRPWEHPNQVPLDIQASIAGGGILTLIPSASPGQRLYIFELSVEIDYGTNNVVVLLLQENNVVGPVTNTLCSIRRGLVGAPTNQFVPLSSPIDFHGAPIDSGFGLQLANTAANTIGVYGTLVWSKDI